MLVFRIISIAILVWICLEPEVEGCIARYFSRQRPDDPDLLVIIGGKGVKDTHLLGLTEQDILTRLSLAYQRKR